MGTNWLAECRDCESPAHDSRAMGTNWLAECRDCESPAHDSGLRVRTGWQSVRIARVQLTIQG